MSRLSALEDSREWDQGALITWTAKATRIARPVRADRMM
jgi:hypothetical protein